MFRFASVDVVSTELFSCFARRNDAGIVSIMSVGPIDLACMRMDNHVSQLQPIMAMVVGTRNLVHGYLRATQYDFIASIILQNLGSRIEFGSSKTNLGELIHGYAEYAISKTELLIVVDVTAQYHHAILLLTVDADDQISSNAKTDDS